jgi:hypothetical protein
VSEVPDPERLDLLASDRRQALVEQLESERQRSHSLESLASAVAGSVDDQVEPVSVSLHHVRLPKLDDAGVLDYDPDSNTVVYTVGNDPLLEGLR